MLPGSDYALRAFLASCWPYDRPRLLKLRQQAYSAHELSCIILINSFARKTVDRCGKRVPALVVYNFSNATGIRTNRLGRRAIWLISTRTCFHRTRR